MVCYTELEDDNTMNDKKFIFVLDGSAYRPMYEKMVHDVQFEYNVSIVVDVPNHGWLK